MFRRFMLILKSKFSRALDKAEDPGEALDYSYEKQRELLQNVRKGIADAVTQRKRLEIQREQLVQRQARLASQARQALTKGSEDLARAALERKALATSEADSLTVQIDALRADEEKLIANQRALETKIERFKTQKEVIKAQYRAAEAQVNISEAMTGVGEEFAEVGQAVRRAQERTEDMRARAGAMDELMESGVFDDAMGVGGDAIDRELAQLSTASSVNADLAALKAELEPTRSSQASLPAGAPQPATINYRKQPKRG